MKSSLVIVKCHESSLDHQKAFSQQLQVITLSTDLINPGDDNLNSFLQPFKRYIQQIYLPLTKITSNDQSNDSALKENAISLQRSIRELDLAIDQCQRVRNVKDDVKRLQEKFRLRYDDSLEKITADLKDIPPLSGRIIWARQIENQLTALMKRLENVIGDRWADHIEGKQLKQVCDELRNYLDTNTLYSEWLTQQLRSDNSRHNKTKDFLLLVEDDLKQNNQNNKLLRVNFDEKQVVIFKEVRYLEWLLPKMNTVHKSIPRTIKTISTEAYNRYPIAMALQAAIYSYNQTKQQINESNEMLLHSHIVNVRETIKEAFGGSKRMKRWVKWDSNNLSEWLTQLSNYVITLQESVLDVNEKLSTIKGLLSELEVTEYSKDNFENIIKQLQVIVDDMQMKGFSNIHVWVNQIDKKIEDILANRIESAIEVWINAFLYIENTKDVDEEDNVNENSYDLTSFSLDHVIHEILLSNQVLYVYPPIEHSRVEYINSLHQYLAVCTSLSRIVTSRYNVFAESIVKQKDFSNLLLNVNKDALMKPFKIVENKVSEAKAYIQSWLQYQVLWDTSSSMVSDKIGKDIQKWFQLLTEIKAARNNIDSDEEEKVQNKVNQKYDSWANDCQQKFSNILLDEIKEVYDDLKLSKSTLENIYLDGSTKDVIVGVEYILKMKAHLPVRKNQVNDLENSEKLLQKQRFLFPRDWVPVSNVIGLFTDFTSILNRRITAMESQLSSLQSKIKDEDVNINNNINNLISSWDKDKPEDGSLVPSDAITYLSTISSQINKLNDDLVRINKAKDALEIEYLSNDKLKDVSNELVDLKEVWIAISPIFDKIFSYKSTLLKDIQPIKLRKGLDELLDIIRHFPPKIRGYSIVEYQQEYINKLLSNQSIIRDLTSDTLKERHWKTIIQTMGLSKIKTVVFSEITLGLVYDSNPIQHKKFVSEVLSVAQGESALEQYLKDIRDFWVNFELNLIARENIRLISNWDILFTSLEDHLNSLSSLKQSPYYKNLPEFQEDTTIWETRLTSLRSIFEIWIEVQRKWIYLRGIFNNADIKAQLPSQYTKFKNIDSDVINLVKRVSSKPNVLDLLQIDNLNRLLDRYESTMSLIQKALGEYLEKQRQVFPRFYFVNNDDLIEIIGNSNEPIKIILHLNKMFAGINSLNLSTVSNSDKQELLGQSIISREGEVVDLVNKVNLTQPVKDWLMELENEMKNTLIVLLEGSFKDIPSENENWTKNCESSFESNSLSNLSNSLETKLKQLSVNVLQDMNSDLRKKLEQLLTEMIHQRDVTRSLINSSISTKNDFGWVYHLRYYWLNNSAGDLLKRLSICMSNASFFYGFEYLGISERLVQTPLTERCYLTLTQALHFGMGGNPFGPAGTGKTESVKMLGNQLGNSCKLHKDVGIFVTLNPGYAGRSNLPDNLKQLFRAVAMAVPDRKLIAQVMLFSQGIVSAEELAGKIVLLFTLCEEQLSSQSHYDFGLRALKSVLVGAGDLKRLNINDNKLKNSSDDQDSDSFENIEKEVLIKSTCDSIVPKLVSEDIPLFKSLLQAVFPGTNLSLSAEKKLIETIKSISDEDCLDYSLEWSEKVLQLKQVLDMRHGIMMVGPSGSGKTMAWKTLFKALNKFENTKGEYFIIDPKAITKEKLYGSLDQNTLEWTDGVFTKILRKLSDTTADRNTHKSRSWIVFDGDVDPEWAENLNSVLDDNKVLTLPTGDRLKIPNFVKIMIEVDSLKNATLATVSRCGMIWFADSTVNVDSILSNHIKTFRKENIIVDSISSSASSIKLQKQTKDKFVDILSSIYSSNPNIVNIALTHTLNQVHIMEPSISSLLSTLYLIVLRGINLAIEYNEINSDFMISDSNLASFVNKWLLYSILWAFGGSMTNDKREVLGKLLFEHSNIDLPSNNKKLIDVFVNINDNSSWIEWNTMVPKMEIESHRVISSDVVITTIDTVRHVEVLKAWLSSHKPLILCGPPGSGKTMTLTSVLESMPEYILASLNFSSGTTPDLILKTFDQFCEIVDSPDGLVLQPNKQIYRESQWLVIFCDEINLPELDAYGTQRVIMFLRQLTEQRGYWNSDCKWITLKRIQFVGACNPPTDAGRTPLPMRFLRHAPILLVDYPAETSLKQIYRCFDHGLLKLHPNLKSFVDPLTNAMVEFYLLNQSHFSVDMAPQYIYSPRELSRWVRGMYEAMEPLEAMTSEELVRLWAHEALRLFHDRLITDQEREWCNNQMDIVASNHFGAFVDINSALQRPILYSNWLTKNYQSTKREHLKEYLMARLKVFYEEELDVPLVIFDDVIEHVLRIDNVLRHPMGHMLLAGESGVGKTVLSRFVSWINGLSVFQIKADSRYNIDQFDEDLRNLLRRVGIENEKICFIFDEGNALSTAFLERMNSLLASGEVPGLFEGDDRVQLLAACRENILSKNNSSVIIDSEDELWRNFTKLVQRNLHVIFTMNPASSDFDNRCMTSPALFNRCVVDWFGTWSQEALIQVGYEFTANIDTGYTDYSMSKEHVNKNMKTLDTLALTLEILKIEYPTLREAIVAALVNMHNVVKKLSIKTSKSGSRSIYISPRDYLDLINKFIKTENEKRSHLEEQQTHIRTGLQKIIETKDKVQDLRVDMVTKEKVLIQKDEQANLKLNSMVSKQNEAEIKKALAEKLTIELKNQNEEITIRKEIVEKELSEAEPALLSAKQSVQNIRKAHLDEVRALGRPPPLVKLTLEMVCIMIGEKNTDWNEIRKIIRREDFISTVVNFDPNSLTPKQVKQVSDEYLSNTELDYNSVDRASKACGPLFLWGESQIKYATILRKVKPLRDEVSNLQEQSIDLEKKQQEAVDQVNLLEADIIQYKNDYATAIRETEIIRNEMNLVKKKVTRAEDLLNSLSQENNRWEITSDTFNKEMSTLIGDCLISAGFLTYLGNFDHKARKYLLTDFYDVLDNLSIPYRTDLDIINFLSTLSDQMKWKSYGLLSDELTIQNAILLSRFQRYPLIIDPPGQALNFILNKYANEKIVKTSFLDSSFTKTLASAIRFGTPLLVQDVETVDPILNPVLNKEIQRTGGRVLIRLGNEDIDFSPKFMIILLTRNPLAKFPPDLCSRVSIINFTITPASLESQVLSAILKSERPDVDTKKNEILLLQSQQSIKIRELEEVLLNKISAVQGGILDDDSVIQNLEVIKAESTQLNTEVEKTEDASSKVDDLARSMNKALLQIAMGSSEGYKDAEKLLAQGMKSGTWVLLRNIHLCSSEWLYTLEKKLYNISLSSDNNFRLFLSCEINNKLPTELLRLSEILLYETSTGIKANIQRFYTNLSSQRVDKLPTERNRLYSLMIWLHSVLQERLRYIPIGWTKKYEFTETDAMFALDIIDQWVDNSAGNRAHINPEDLPWDAIKTLLSQSVYGGRIDHDHDQIILDIFINKIFHPRNYLTNAALASDINGETLLTLPDGLNRQAFETWMKDLPDTNLPTLVGLPTTAETQLRIISGQRVLSKLTVLQGLDEETVDISSSSNLTIVSNVLKDNINKWQYSLPTTKTLNVLTYDLSSLDNLSTAFERCLYREIVKGKSILALILNELTLLNSYLNGETKLSNLIRDIIDRLNKGKVPKSWFSEYTVNKDINISQWIDDFVKRIKNLEKYLPIISITNNLSQSIASGVYWLGGMFSPEAFITATRQAAAQINKWNLEELELVLIIDDNSKDLSGGILVEGLILEGAVYSNSSKSINISDDLRNLLPISKLRWEQRNHLSSNTVISFPMYLNETRNILIADVKIHFPTAIDSTIWAQRGVALTIQSSIL
eukprot:gene17680-23270_t